LTLTTSRDRTIWRSKGQRSRSRGQEVWNSA